MRHIWYNATAVKSITGKYGSSTEPPLICATKPPINGPMPKPKPFKDAYQRAVWASLGKGLVCNMPIMPEVLMRPEAMPMMTRALRDSFGKLELSNRELVALNQELESFSYSVSHDLRSPLRSMDGFSLALLEDYGDRLDDEARDSLQRIRAASQRIARLNGAT